MLSLSNTFFNSFYKGIQYKPWLFCIFLFVANSAIKFYNIAYDSYNLDEAWHMFYGQMPFSELLDFARKDPNPPLYNLLAGYWVKIFGISETGVRSFSALLSVATALLIFLFCRKHLNIVVAVWASLFFSVAEIHYMYAHNARVYALLSFLIMLSAMQLIKLLESPGTKNILLLILVNAAVLFTHTVAAFFFIVQAIVALTYFKANKKTSISVLLSIAISTLPFLLWVLTSPYYSEQAPSSWLKAPDWMDIHDILIHFFDTFTVAYLFLGLLIIWLAKTKAFSTSRYNRNTLVLIISWAILPVAFDAIVSHLLVPIWTPRYMLYSSLGFYILFAIVLDDLFDKRTTLVTIVGLFVIGYSIFHLDFDRTKKEPWRAVAAFVKERKTDETLILISPYFQYPTFSFYYDINLYKDYEHTLYRLALDNIHMADNAGVLNELTVNDFKKIIFIISQQSINDPSGLQKKLEEKYKLKEKVQLDDIKCSVFTNPTYGTRSKELLDNETYDTLNMPDNIMFFEKAFSGSYVSVTDQQRPYSKGINKKLKGLVSEGDTILAKVWFYGEKNSVEGSLVSTLENKDSVYQWKGLNMQKEFKTNEWNELSFKFSIPKGVKDDDVMKLYFWNTGKHKVYIDDLQYKVLK